MEKIMGQKKIIIDLTMVIVFRQTIHFEGTMPVNRIISEYYTHFFINI